MNGMHNEKLFECCKIKLLFQTKINPNRLNPSTLIQSIPSPFRPPLVYILIYIFFAVSVKCLVYSNSLRVPSKKLKYNKILLPYPLNKKKKIKGSSFSLIKSWLRSLTRVTHHVPKINLILSLYHGFH